MSDFLEKISPSSWKLRTWISPGAKKSKIEGIYQGCIKIKIGAPPVDNKANKALIEFLAGILGIKKRNIEIVSGQKNRKKVLILTMEEDLDIENILKKYI